MTATAGAAGTSGPVGLVGGPGSAATTPVPPGGLTRSTASVGLVRLASEVLLHVMVLSLFVEGIAAGPISTGRVIAVAAGLAVLLVALGRPGQGLFPHPWVAVPAVLMTTWTVVSGAWALDRGAWLESVLELALTIIFFVAISLLVDSRALVHRLLVTLAVGATLVAPLAMVQFLQGARAVGLQGDPNTFALYQLAALPVVCFLFTRAYDWARVWWALSALLLVVSVVSAQSRGAFIGLGLVTLWLLWNGTGPAVGSARRLVAVVGGGIVLGVAAVSAALLLPRFDLATTLQDGGTGRLDIWRTAVLAWWDHPLLGLGAGGYEPESGRLLSQTPGVGLDPYSVLFEGIRVHNSYLEPLVEQGPVGLAAFLMLLAGIGVTLETQRRLHPGDLTGALVPALIAFIASAVFLSVTANKLLWILAGLAAVLPYLTPRDQTPDPQHHHDPDGPRGPAPSLRETP